MTYCQYFDSSGSETGDLRGFSAKFENADTGSVEVFEFGSLVATGTGNTVDCETVTIPTTVSQYNVRVTANGIGGFIFKDADGNTYAPCTGGCEADLAYEEYQDLMGPIIGFHVYTYAQSDDW